MRKSRKIFFAKEETQKSKCSIETKVVEFLERSDVSTQLTGKKDVTRQRRIPNTGAI